MILENIRFNNTQDFLHLERYVNQGSPSGFTDIYTTSFLTSPKERFSSFHLAGVRFHDESIISKFGTKPKEIDDAWHMLVHPDMLYNPVNNDFFSKASEIKIKAVKVAPTASGRTVKLLEGSEWYIKLHYHGLIGRVDRQITTNHALSAIEVTDYIKCAIDSKTLPSFFYLQSEPYAKVAILKVNDKQYEWGMVFREPNIYPLIKKKHFLLPAFSLFSNDKHAPDDPMLLCQLILKQSKKVEDYLFEDIIAPVYNVYFSLLLNLGIQLECHSQNTLFVMDENYKIIGMVARDGDSIDKDISLMVDRNIPYKFKTDVYKCRYRTSYKYFIMHSFMFDFKLGEYLISPIIKAAQSHFKFNEKELISRIRQFNETFINKLPSDFFPSDNKWYKNTKKVHRKNGRQKYVGVKNPQFRMTKSSQMI